MTRTEKLRIAAEADSTVVVDRKDAETTFGNNPDYLLDIHGITKADLYEKLNEVRGKLEPPLPPMVGKTGVHRVRWVIFKEALYV